ncbi:helix-turn-helix domain-containing protein [Halapricum salinum]|nr:helix-turn-helix domain-containing protein [Halapricum salinum]
MTGMRAELELPAAEACPVAGFSEGVEGSVSSVRRADDGAGGATEQFTVSGEHDPDVFDGDLEPLFEYDSATVYQFDQRVSDCICEYVERRNTPIAEVRAEEGLLVLELHLADLTALRDLVTELREHYGTVRIRYLLQIDGDAEGTEDIVPVDRSRLTDRQREVLETAYEMGYFAYPRGANATDVATELGIEPSTFTEHLAAAQSKLLDELLSPA